MKKWIMAIMLLPALLMSCSKEVNEETTLPEETNSSGELALSFRTAGLTGTPQLSLESTSSNEISTIDLFVYKAGGTFEKHSQLPASAFDLSEGVYTLKNPSQALPPGQVNNSTSA